MNSKLGLLTGPRDGYGNSPEPTTVGFDPTPYVEIYHEKGDANFCADLVYASAKTIVLRPSAKRVSSAKKWRKLDFRGLKLSTNKMYENLDFH